MREQSVAILVVVSVATALLAAGAVTATAQETTDLSVDVTQADDGNATVTVTQNETGVENSSVAVETVDDEGYDGVGEYLTDENGTVGLPAPANDTSVRTNATVGTETVSTEATLAAADEDDTESPQNFGQMLSAFIEALLNDGGDEDTIGESVSNFVHENNPAADKIPDHAGQSAEDTERGPPDHAGPGGDDEDGDDGEESDEEDDEENDEEDQKEDGESGQGPPDHAGPPDR